MSIDYAEALAFQATIQHDIPFKHIIVYIEGDNKRIINTFNLQDYKDIPMELMKIICSLQDLLYNFSMISMRWISYHNSEITYTLVHGIEFTK